MMMRSTQKGFLIKSQLCMLRVISDISIARVTGCVYPREGYSSASPRVNRANNLIQPCSALGKYILRGTKSDICGIQYA